ncbi:HAMP domain-containing histidine kinase [Parasulfuritortus cantonensis]|uniref:histidine kinase n=1 Tax=Parasulfuritortus cantonensis TaxID=2528202 RepID=A0A4V2NWR5_9PROT|nr:HAMP domain-containing sensor histidine kinase [Parasulfuritortus cantonensis]TCJ18402.1 HAMP domain-containing histidine kinase [Parasulfuritortus cantonensis]
MFGLISILGGLLLFQLVRTYTLNEMDEDILRQKDEMVRLMRSGDDRLLREEFLAGALASGTSDFFVRLSDGAGKVLLASDMTAWPNIPRAVDLLVGEPVGAYRFLTIDLADERHKARVLVVRVNGARCLQMGVSLADSELFFAHFRRIGMLILALMLGLGGLTGWALARKAMAGVEGVTAAATRIADGHFSERVEVAGQGREIDSLVAAFNTMAGRVETVLTEMRQVNDNIAHDLRSPLTRIRGLAEAAVVNGSVTGEGAEVAGSIVEECDRLMLMINTMLDITEAEAGLGGLKLAELDLGELVAQVVDLFAGVAEDKGVALTGDSPGRVAVRADRRKLQRALANLVDNAIKYTPAGGRVCVTARPAAGRVAVEVADTGPGIAAEDLPRIFDRFFRSDRSRHFPGNGLGLSLAQAVAHAHGGDITVGPATGGGSVFRLVLPAVRAA